MFENCATLKKGEFNKNVFVQGAKVYFVFVLRADKGSLTFLTSLDVVNIQYRVTVCKNLCRNVTAVHDRSIYWKEI